MRTESSDMAGLNHSFTASNNWNAYSFKLNVVGQNEINRYKN